MKQQGPTNNVQAIEQFKTTHKGAFIKTIRVRGFIPQQNKGLVLAMERIAEAREEKTKELVLAGLGLTEIPDEVFDLKELTSLVISENQIKEIPDKIGRLEKLKIISAGNNLISEVHSHIGTLPELHTLLFSNCSMRKFPKGILSLQNLANLNLSNNKIKWVPTGLKDLNFEELDMSGNPILNLPEQFHITTSARLHNYYDSKLDERFPSPQLVTISLEKTRETNTELNTLDDRLNQLMSERKSSVMMINSHESEYIFNHIDNSLQAFSVLHISHDKWTSIENPNRELVPFDPEDLNDMFLCMREVELRTKLLILDFENGQEFAEKFYAPDFNLILYKRTPYQEIEEFAIRYLLEDLLEGQSFASALYNLLRMESQPYKLTYNISGRLEEIFYFNLKGEPVEHDISPNQLAVTLFRHVLDNLYSNKKDLYSILNKILPATSIPVTDISDTLLWLQTIELLKKRNKLEEFFEIVQSDKPFSATLLDPLLHYL